MSGVVNLRTTLEQIPEPWVPAIVGELNGQYVKLGKARDSYVWHHHELEDELFLIVQGELHIHLKDEAGAESVVTVGARFGGQTQHPLRDDVAQDLVRAAGEAQAR